MVEQVPFQASRTLRSAKQVTLKAVRIDETSRLVTQPCPYCGHAHYHSGGKEPGAGNGERAPHCFWHSSWFRRGLGPYRIEEIGTVKSKAEGQRFFAPLADVALLGKLDGGADGPFSNYRFSPLTKAMLKALFPAGQCSSESFVYKNKSAGVSFAVLAPGEWTARYKSNGDTYEAHGDEITQLLEILTGVSAGWQCVRMLEAATGKSFEGQVVQTLAEAIDKATSQAHVQRAEGPNE